ncbi:hypothetical protein [Treponema endosymbiont of Eucomonympha sp.]|uniref:hypothetical protein n=1 Tax=Treponema endosymbiont of Eucomonympha sp. TaxID=1580831 RepID=UPI001396A995|nr:hypothetical protein [Treponema endosymbiont of Eucomonympha sp.]
MPDDPLTASLSSANPARGLRNSAELRPLTNLPDALPTDRFLSANPRGLNHGLPTGSLPAEPPS